MTADELQSYLSNLGALAGVSADLDDSHSIEIALESGLAIRLQFDTDANVLLMCADLFVLAPDQRATLLEEAMKLNCLGLGTGGATLGLDTGRDMLVLSAVWSAETLSEAAFFSALGGFTEVAERFLHGLTDDRLATTEPEAVPRFASLIRG